MRSPGFALALVVGRLLFLNAVEFCGLKGDDIAANLLFKGRGDIAVLAQELLGVLTALAEANIANGEPCTALLYQTHLQTEVDEASLARNTLTVHNIELGDTEGRGH